MKPDSKDSRKKPVYRAFPITIYEALVASAVTVAIVCWFFFSIDLSGIEAGAAVTIFTSIIAAE